MHNNAGVYRNGKLLKEGCEKITDVAIHLDENLLVRSRLAGGTWSAVSAATYVTFDDQKSQNRSHDCASSALPTGLYLLVNRVRDIAFLAPGLYPNHAKSESI